MSRFNKFQHRELMLLQVGLRLMPRDRMLSSDKKLNDELCASIREEINDIERYWAEKSRGDSHDEVDETDDDYASHNID